MKLSDVIHPKRVRVGDHFFEVVAHSRLSDDQVREIVRHYLRTHKLRAKDKGRLIQIVTQFDQDSAKLL